MKATVTPSSQDPKLERGAIRFRAMIPLMDRYGIRPDDQDRWIKLSLYLACEYAPNFVKRIDDDRSLPHPGWAWRPRGRPKGATHKRPETSDSDAILRKIDQMKARNHSLSDWQACQLLAGKIGPKNRGWSAKTIYRHVRQARSRPLVILGSADETNEEAVARYFREHQEEKPDTHDLVVIISGFTRSASAMPDRLVPTVTVKELTALAQGIPNFY